MVAITPQFQYFAQLTANNQPSSIQTKAISHCAARCNLKSTLFKAASSPRSLFDPQSPAYKGRPGKSKAVPALCTPLTIAALPTSRGVCRTCAPRHAAHWCHRSLRAGGHCIGQLWLRVKIPGGGSGAGYKKRSRDRCCSGSPAASCQSHAIVIPNG